MGSVRRSRVLGVNAWRTGTVLLAVVVAGTALSGCGTGGLAVKKDVWEAQEDFERRQTSLSEKILQLEGRIAILEEENAALRYQLGEFSKQLAGLDTDFSRGLEAIRTGQEQLGIELEDRIRTVDTDREGDRTDMLQRMEIVLDEVTRENESLREEITQLRSSVGTGYTHTVQRGETLATIAERYGVTVQAIVAANDISNPNVISVGAELFIPQ
jgi:prefoldin subunit 5